MTKVFKKYLPVQKRKILITGSLPNMRLLTNFGSCHRSKTHGTVVSKNLVLFKQLIKGTFLKEQLLQAIELLYRSINFLEILQRFNDSLNVFYAIDYTNFFRSYVMINYFPQFSLSRHTQLYGKLVNIGLGNVICVNVQ